MSIIIKGFKDVLRLSLLSSNHPACTTAGARGTASSSNRFWGVKSKLGKTWKISTWTQKISGFSYWHRDHIRWETAVLQLLCWKSSYFPWFGSSICVLCWCFLGQVTPVSSASSNAKPHLATRAESQLLVVEHVTSTSNFLSFVGDPETLWKPIIAAIACWPCSGYGRADSGNKTGPFLCGTMVYYGQLFSVKVDMFRITVQNWHPAFASLSDVVLTLETGLECN